MMAKKEQNRYCRTTNHHPRLHPAQPENIAHWIAYLANDIGSRPARYPEKLEEAAQYLESIFQTFGYQVLRQPHHHRLKTYNNIIAVPKGADALSRGEKLLVVGAHYDTVSTTRGADDNASGVAGLLELARIFAGSPPSSLRLVAFCPEEPPAFHSRLMGSYVYAADLKQHKVFVQGMICLEMIGYFVDTPGSQSYPLPGMRWWYPNQGDFIALVGNLRSRGWTKQVKHLFRKGTDLPVECLNAPSLLYGIDFSDHWSFNKMGFPALMVTDTAFYRNPHYHRASDLPTTLDCQRTAKVIDGLAHAVHNLARP